jgi:HAD superfamily hydrolase (TIGR01509 family)
VSLRALVFDFDGLILDTETPEYVTVAEAYAEFGLDLSIDEWRGIVGTADHPHWTEMLGDALGRPYDVDDVRRRRVERHHALIAEEQVRPGVIELLDAAVDADLAVAVASSSPTDWVAGHLDRLGLRSRFASLHTRDHVARGRAKPAPDLFRLAVDHLDVAPGSAVALEDSPHGVTAASAAGLPVVAVPNRITEGGDFSAADLVVPSLADVALDDLRALTAP